MDELDQNLLEAWHAVGELLQDRPWSLARRMERAARKELRRPVRAWCVALRASDTRIGAHEWCSETDADRACDGEDHQLRLKGPRLRALCRPVSIDWPGLPVPELAERLGRDERTVWSWAKKGLLDRANPNKHTIGRKQLFWSGPLDPQADDGRGPWAVWGTLWQGLAGWIPQGFEQAVVRQPRLRDSAQDRRTVNDAWPGRYRGWDWVCPGRTVGDGTAAGRHVPCGRVCKKLWLPLQAWTLGDALGERAGEAWQTMPRPAMVPSGLACAKCWGLRFDNVESCRDEAWNRFVSVVSGGLLYGREVRFGPHRARRAGRKAGSG